MNFGLAKPASRWTTLAIALVVAFLMTEASARNWLAARDFDSNTPQGRARAVELEPGNADDWYRLGLNRMLDFENADPQAAIEAFRHSVSIDPRSAGNWMALGDAYEQTGDIPQARQAFETAVADYPDSGEVRWRYGSFLLRQGDLQQAYAEIHRALLSTPTLATLAVSRVFRVTQDPQVLITEVLPENDRVMSDALTWLIDAQQPQGALAVWNQMVRIAHPVPLKVSAPLVDLLVGKDQGDAARNVWRQALALSGTDASGFTPQSLVFNGGFETDSVNDGLDWRWNPVPGITYAYDTSHEHSGRRALSVTFDGSQNLNYHDVLQPVPVEPNTRYHFSAALRTAGISTDSGVGLALTFFTQPSISLEPLAGDHDWLTQQMDFTTGPNTHIVQIGLNRNPSEKFDNKLAGTIWLDDVTLTPLGPARP